MKEETKSGLLKEEIEEIQRAFNKYDINKTSKIKPKLFLKEMDSSGMNIKAPLIYKIFKDFDTDENDKNEGILFSEILDTINKRLGNLETEEGIKTIYDLLKEKPEDNFIHLSYLKEIASSFGIKISDEELKNMMERASESGEGLTSDEFLKIMIKQN